MSVKDTNTIDGMGVEKSTNTLVFLIIDPYPWNTGEYDHLKTFQQKINSYVAYIENKGYESAYGSKAFDGFRIEAEFKYSPTEAGKSFFEAGKKQLAERNIEFVWSTVKKDDE